MHDIQLKIQEMEKKHQWQKIIDLLKPLVEQGENAVYVLRALGFAYSQLDRYHEARFCYKQWIELEPHRAQPYYHVGFTFYDAGQWNEAVEWFDQALERFSDYMVCLYRKGVALFLAGKSRKAKEDLKKAIIVYQNAEDAQFKQRQGKYYYRSIFYLGKCYLQIRFYKNARACFEKIMAEDRRMYIDALYVKYNLALSLMHLKEFARAEQIVAELTRLKPRAEWLYDFWGRLLVKQQRYVEAIEKLDLALKIRVQPYILIDRARAHFMNGKTQLAKADLNDALRRDQKGKHKILLELAKIALQEKQFAQAMAYARRAIEFKQRIYEADYAEAHLLLSDIFRATGENQKAQQEFQIAQELCPDLAWEDDLLLKTRIIL
ncbi:tetratricopeptide repeat protein [Caldithrix abyssi]